MLLIQISAAQGPAECELAVKYTLQRLLQDAKQHAISLTLLDSTESQHGYLSVLLQADGESVQTWANGWSGSIQWVFASKIRPAHKRKNWFVGVAQFALPATLPTDDEIVFQACRASGSGGQHVNTTDSAVHALHVASGIAVKVMSERSQHANKKRARLLLAQKLAEQRAEQAANAAGEQHATLYQVARGNPRKVFVGRGFQER